MPTTGGEASMDHRHDLFEHPTSNALRRLRKAAGLRQVALAAAIGRSQSYVSAIERGDIQPTSTDLLRLTEELGADVRLYFPYARDGNE